MDGEIRYYGDINLPYYRSQSVAWLTNRYPQDEAKFRRMTRKQLCAIIKSIVVRQAKQEAE